MTLDVKKYLQQISEADWNRGLCSKYALSGNYFFKRLTAKAPSKVHDFLLNTKLSSTVNSFVTRFVDYYNLSDSECQYLKYKGENAKYNHVYVFEKVNFVKLEDYFGSKDIKEYTRVLDDLNYFFNALDFAGITYHDVCWDNIVWNKTTNKLCVIDLDSMVESTNTYKSLQNLGNPLFHVSFLKFGDKYATTRSPLHDIKYLNLCIYHNIFFAFVLGLSQNDKRFIQMEERNSVNRFVAKYIEGDYIDTLENGQIIDKEFVKVLVNVTQIVSFYIERKYNGNPYKDMVLLANELLNKIPAKSVPSKPVLPIANFKSNKKSGNAPLSVQFTDFSKNATAWKWDFGDGNKSTVQNPINTYNAAGNYTVKLTVSNTNGTNSTSETINVLTVPPKPLFPIARFTSNVKSGNAPLSVQFVDSSLNSTRWEWDFGDGNKSTVQNPVHTFTVAGNYAVTLTVSNANGTNSTFETINVLTVPPKTIGQIITLSLPQISSKIYKSSPKKILKYGLILCLLIPILSMMFSSWDNEDSKNTEYTLPTSSVPKDTNSDTNSIGMEFVLIPAGEFTMGSSSSEDGREDNEGSVHKVTIEEPFYLGKFEVTQEQWRKVMGSNPPGSKGDNYPVGFISWDYVQEFIEKLNEMEGTKKYRLPSEAEWEYACRAGESTRYYFGDDESKLGDYAWYHENSDSKTHPVGQKKPNPWGLYDMHGNVLEWCQDSWHDNYDGAPSDGSAWEDGDSSYRVIRGGSRYDSAFYCRSASRSYKGQGSRDGLIGFRVLMEATDFTANNEYTPTEEPQYTPTEVSNVDIIKEGTILDGTFNQFNYGSYRMIMEITSVDGLKFDGVLYWPELGDSKTGIRGEIDSNLNQVWFTEYEQIQGSSRIVLNGNYYAEVKENSIIGYWNWPNGEKGGTFELLALTV